MEFSVLCVIIVHDLFSGLEYRFNLDCLKNVNVEMIELVMQLECLALKH